MVREVWVIAIALLTPILSCRNQEELKGQTCVYFEITLMLNQC